MGPVDPRDEEGRIGAVTRLLRGAGAGDRRAAGELLPLVYDELRSLARQRMRSEQAGQTLQATALVHEAYLRLLGGADGPNWDGRRHFYAAAAEAMRRILVERARRRSSRRHGGGRERVDLDDAALAVDGPPDRLLALDEALTALAERHPDKAQLVRLRFFAGLTIQEAADTMGVSTATAERHWTFARAWLYRRLAAR